MSKAKASSKINHFLVEIGVEELPANYLVFGQKNDQAFFRSKFEQVLKDSDEADAYAIEHMEIHLTPRRIILDGNLILVSTAKKDVIYGPPEDRAYDSSGAPTRVLEGFLKSKGIKASQIRIAENKGKRCIAYDFVIKPKKIKALIDEVICTWLKELVFPKLMWWNESSLRFPRPIRTCLAFVDNQKIKLHLDKSVEQGVTRVIVNANRKTIKPTSPKVYWNSLAKHGIKHRPDERRELIKAGVQKVVTKSLGASISQDDLIDEIVFLTENPVCISGEFDREYADLPTEVLTSSLSKSQRLFSIKNNKGKHLPFFIAVLDGDLKSKTSVKKTISSILKAKLQDSHFFYEEDSKLYGGKNGGVQKLQTDLEKLQYIKGIGTVADKVKRLQHISGSIGRAWGLSNQNLADLQTCFGIYKTDLLTQMVGEFPDLQGIAGGYYCNYIPGGVADDIGVAIKEHYLPTSIDGPLPKSHLGAIVSLLDKLDLVIACFALGKIPTSSQDRYGLKRSMTSVLRIAKEFRIDLDYSKIAQELIDYMQANNIGASVDTRAAMHKLNTFYQERSSFFFEGLGFDRGLTQAVTASGGTSFLSILDKLTSLSKLQQSESFASAQKIIERTSNLLRGSKDFRVCALDENLFEHDSERDLFRVYNQNKESVLEAIQAGDFQKATSLYAESFNAILHTFFEQVLVNVDDINIRLNRLNLLENIRTLYVNGIADLSKIKLD
ncbi:MAG: glycyl-tRNA synthetase beta chain [Candidatus Omnitrophota bacterium]|jgi:glycyl-tRNA synthetase beta chain